MYSLPFKKIALLLCALALSEISPSLFGDQFPGEEFAQSAQDAKPLASAQDPAAAAPAIPSGKPRLSQELQITGDSAWLDTGIDVQAGERVVFSASGTMRYPDQQTDAAPGGLARGFK